MTPTYRIGQIVLIADTTTYEGTVRDIGQDGDGVVRAIQLQPGRWFDLDRIGRTVRILAQPPEPEYVEGAWYTDADGDPYYRRDGKWHDSMKDDSNATSCTNPPFTLIVPPGYSPKETP